MLYDLSGEWNVTIDDGKIYKMQLPGTLDEAGIGYKDTLKNAWHPEANIGDISESLGGDKPIATRFTRKVSFEGEARIYKELELDIPKNKRIFLEVKRARALRLFIDKKEYEHSVEPSLSSAHIFEITGIESGRHEFCFISDNSYKGWPHKSITFSSAATDETQTNWNGIIDEMVIRAEEPNYIYAVRVYPDKTGKNLVSVEVDIDAAFDYAGNVTIVSDALKTSCEIEVEGEAGYQTVRFNDLELKADVKKWDEYEGSLYDLTASLNTASISTKTVSFGIRSFGDDGQGHLALNNRRIFLRSEANCGEFPETGYEPATVDEWVKVLNTYKGYGINCVRFHSHCPPEAAFTAADSLGMMMQPELSNWNTEDSFESEENYNYYLAEMRQIILQLANHPSFVMLTLGNELQAHELGITRMKELLDIARTLDDTRMYANGSNPFLGERGFDPESDFYTAQIIEGHTLRATSAGWDGDGSLKEYLNNEYPTAKHNYDDAFEILRKNYSKPVFSFEVGQYEVLPDFDELGDFKGISIPVNYEIVKKKVEESGITLDEWKKYVEATGELSKICYREEIEANLRTKDMSGISLLGLQDFPGQGTAIVGMLNSHLQPKPFNFAKPDEFAKFFRSSLPLVLLDKYTYENTEKLEAYVLLANYDKCAIKAKAYYKLSSPDKKDTIIAGELIKLSEKEVLIGQSRYDVAIVDNDGDMSCPAGKGVIAGKIEIPLNFVESATRFDLTVEIGEAINTYPVWVYPECKPVCPEKIYETDKLDDKAKEVLEAGGKVYLSPASTLEALPKSVKAHFSTDFWSVGTFPLQSGTMGQLIDEKHPIFESFPTEFYTNWQWWIFASQRAVILPRRIKSIITEMDSYAYLKPMAQLFEAKVGEGKLLFSSLVLQDLQQYPEARALLKSVYDYMDSDRFAPVQDFSLEELKDIC